MSNRKNWKRILLKSGIVIAVLILLLLVIASPLAKYLIQKYDVKYTGREITVNNVFINPLTGMVRMKDFRVYEDNSDSVFMYMRRFSTRFSLLKLLNGTYEITS